MTSHLFSAVATLAAQLNPTVAILNFNAFKRHWRFTVYASVTTVGLVAQTPSNYSRCRGFFLPPQIPQTQIAAATCGPSSAAYTSKYSRQSFYVPDSIKDPVVTVNITLHIFMPTAISDQFQTTVQYGTFLDQDVIGGISVFAGPTRLKYMLSRVSDVVNTNGYDRHSRSRAHYYQFNDVTNTLNFSAGSYLTASGNTFNNNTYLSDSRVQYHVTNVYYYKNNYLYFSNSADPDTLLHYIHAFYPNRLKEGFPVVNPGRPWTAGTFASGCFVSATEFQPYVLSPTNGWDDNWFWKNLPHEIGHWMGWSHMYFGWWNSVDGSYNDSRSPEDYTHVNGSTTSPAYPSFQSVPVLDCQHPDFLSDVFPLNVPFASALISNGNPPVTAGCGNRCYENGYYYSRNVMQERPDPTVLDTAMGWMSPLQMGRRIRTLHFNPFVRQYAADMTSNANYPWVVNSNETWDFDIQMYHDVVVKAGATLSITCRVAMPLGGRIKVERGARLVLDGGELTTWCKSGFWAGVEVEGSSNVDPVTNNLPSGYNTDHGIFIVNGGTVSHAENGVRNYARNANGNIDWNSMGGMIRATQAVFENNWRDVEMLSAPWAGNGCWFQGCQFKTTGILVPGNPAYGPGDHVSLWNVSGLPFRACSFSCAPGLYAQAIGGRGTGIRSIDAVYTLYKNSTGTPCSFSGLEYGLYAANTNPLKVPMVQDALFNGNYKDGAHLAGINNLAVKNNTFTGFPATVNCFGLYLDQCRNYNVRSNQFSGNVSVQGVGFAANNSQAGAHELYRNDFSGMLAGVAAYGNNSGLTNAIDGLRMNCNRFNQGLLNQFDIAMLETYAGNNVVPPTVKAVQGDYYAGNSYTLMVRNTYGAAAIPNALYGNETQWYIDENSPRTVVHYCSPNTFCKPLYKDPAVNVVTNPAWPAYNYALHCPATPAPAGGGGSTPLQTLANLNAFITAAQAANAEGRLSQDISNAVGAKLNCFVTEPEVANADSVIAICKSKQGVLHDADVLTVFAYLHKRDYGKATEALAQISADNQQWVPLLTELIRLDQAPQELYGLNNSSMVLPLLRDYVTNEKKGSASAKALLERATAERLPVPRNLPRIEQSQSARLLNAQSDDHQPENVDVEGIISDDNRLLVYPNPAGDQIWVLYQGPKAAEANVILFDAAGRPVYSCAIENNRKLNINLSGVNSGIYVLKVRDGDRFVAVQKITVLR